MTTVLIVDDDPMILESTRIYLENKGFNIICASNTCDAFQKLKDSKIHIAVVDIFMPQQGGFEFIMAQKKTLPIIAMSGVSSHRFKPLEFAESLGADATLAKPFNPKELVQTIHTLTEHPGL